MAAFKIHTKKWALCFIISLIHTNNIVKNSQLCNRQAKPALLNKLFLLIDAVF